MNIDNNNTFECIIYLNLLILNYLVDVNSDDNIEIDLYQNDASDDLVDDVEIVDEIEFHSDSDDNLLFNSDSEDDDDDGNSSDSDDFSNDDIDINNLNNYNSDSDSDSEIHIISFKNIGMIGIEVYKKLILTNIITNTNPLIKKENVFLEFIILYFVNNLNIKNNIKQFMNCLPNLDRINNVITFLNSKKSKEILILKLILDFYEIYYLNYETPLYIKFQIKLLPTMINYYNIISNLKLNSLIIDLNLILLNINKSNNKINKNYFKTFNNSIEYIKFYKNLRNYFINLNEGNLKLENYII